eukprot:593230-Amphidinium_carterae.1
MTLSWRRCLAINDLTASQKEESPAIRRPIRARLDANLLWTCRELGKCRERHTGAGSAKAFDPHTAQRDRESTLTTIRQSV